jgi:prevent-host-death family protein
MHMKTSRGIEPVTTLKTRSAELIRRARETGQPIVITQNGKATAVLQDVESFERQRKALLLLRYLSQAEDEIRRGKGVSHAKALRHFDKKLKALRRG